MDIAKESKMLVEYSKALEEKFFEALDSKTNWGRNDLKAMFKDVKHDTLTETLIKSIEEIAL